MARATPATVLIADDDLLFARSVQILLEDECGCEVFLSPSADDAMDRISGRRSFDALIVDLEILDSGEPLLGRRIQLDQDGMKVVVMTAHPAALNAAREGRVDADAFLNKPLDPAVLLEVLRSVLTSEESHQKSKPVSTHRRSVR